MHRKNAFSLVELSIVLVILGLLVGGVLTGKALIHAAEIRSVVTEMEKFKTAIFAFKDKYFYLPGDLPNAYQIYGANCYPVGSGYSVPSQCTTDGNGKIEELPWAVRENWISWRQLALSGLIDGTYTGWMNLSDGTNWDRTAGYNAGIAKMGAIAAWHLEYTGPSIGYIDRGVEGNALILKNNINMDYPNQPLWHADAYGIDLKLDDGMPFHGKVQHGYPNHALANANCHQASNIALTATYNLPSGNEDQNCQLVFFLQ